MPKIKTPKSSIVNWSPVYLTRESIYVHGITSCFVPIEPHNPSYNELFVLIEPYMLRVHDMIVWRVRPLINMDKRERWAIRHRIHSKTLCKTIIECWKNLI